MDNKQATKQLEELKIWLNKKNYFGKVDRINEMSIIFQDKMKEINELLSDNE